MRAWYSSRQWWRDWWADTKGSIAVGASACALAILVIAVLQSIDLMEKYPKVNWGNVWEPFAAVGTISANAIADLAYGIVDPRVRRRAR